MGREGEPDMSAILKYKHPISSLVNPVARIQFDEELYHGGQSPDRRSRSPVKLQMHIDIPSTLLIISRINIGLNNNPGTEHFTILKRVKRISTITNNNSIIILILFIPHYTITVSTLYIIASNL